MGTGCSTAVWPDHVMGTAQCSLSSLAILGGSEGGHRVRLYEPQHTLGRGDSPLSKGGGGPRAVLRGCLHGDFKGPAGLWL